jgi:hypothetical protein
MVPVGWLSLRTAPQDRGRRGRGEALYRRLMLHRRLVQVVGMLAIFVTSMFGMYQNINISILN